MKKSLIIMALLFGMSSLAFSQGTGEIRGRVLDSKTGTTMPGANVVVRVGGNIIGCQTDNKGNFVLKPLSPGTYNVEFSYTGYGQWTVENVYVYSDEIVRIGDISLVYGIDIPGAVIYGDKLIGTDAIPKMRPKEIEKIPGKTDIKKLVSMMSADIQTTDDGALYFRGSRDNDFVYYVDGMKKQGGDVNIPSIAIGSIQVYTGSVPARYGDFTGGCIVIETQSYNNWLNSRQ